MGVLGSEKREKGDLFSFGEDKLQKLLDKNCGSCYITLEFCLQNKYIDWSCGNETLLA